MVRGLLVVELTADERVRLERGARRRKTAQALAQHGVQLLHVPVGERAQERAPASREHEPVTISV